MDIHVTTSVLMHGVNAEGSSKCQCIRRIRQYNGVVFIRMQSADDIIGSPVFKLNLYVTNLAITSIYAIFLYNQWIDGLNISNSFIRLNNRGKQAIKIAIAAIV